MDGLYDYKKFAILYVDDEEKSLKYFTLAFQNQFRIFTAPSADEGYAILEKNPDDFGILMTDQRMPGAKGVELIQRARQLRPRLIRILATAYSDLNAAIDAVNTGAIYKYVHKPWDVPTLEATLKRAMEFYLVQKERDQLLRDKLSAVHNMLIADRVVSLGLLAAGLTHHIRNSLVAIRTFLDLAPEKLKEESVDLDQLRNPNFWKDFYRHVQRQLLRITELLTDLGLATGGVDARFEDPVRLGDLIDEAQRLVPPGKVEVRNRLPADLPVMLADRPKLARFFELILRDEVLNLPDGGIVEFTGRTETLPDGLEILKLEVRDNGPGLTGASIRSVFDPFFLRRDDPQEFGINLMACFFIVYHHGGKIEVQSEPGRGTSFHIQLPLKPGERSLVQDDREFLPQMLSNEALWEKLLAGAA